MDKKNVPADNETQLSDLAEAVNAKPESGIWPQRLEKSLEDRGLGGGKNTATPPLKK